jgi:EAL domain-containing protein (putative c-di-GMP-specific phosphodiesterase class I)
MAGFARDTGCRVIAEGVETAGELAALRTIGIELAQGYLLGRPLPLTAAAALFHGGRSDARPDRPTGRGHRRPLPHTAEM